jgi:DNA polymerase-3 subunit epsilon
MHYVIIDIETTGGSPKNSKITEIAMYKHDGVEIIDQYETLIDPEMQIPEFIVRLTGISDKMVKDAPKFHEVAKKIVEFTEGCVFVAHNVSFDYGVIRQEFRKLGFDYRRPHLCTVIASRKIIPGFESYSLGKLTRDLGIELIGRHRAGGDAFATAKLFTILIEKDSDDLVTFVNEDVNPQIFHPNLDIAELDEIPDKTGVYRFYNEFNQLIFVGKSKGVRRRIEQHLKNTKSKKGAQLIKEIAKIEYELTGSELISILLEHNLIKNNNPSQNSPLKNTRYSHGMFHYTDENGYDRFYIGVTTKETKVPLKSYTSKKEAISHLEKMIEKYHLCQKLCDLYASTSSCFQYSLQECNGACINEESTENYNLRSQELVNELKTNEDSYYIIENGRQKGEKSFILVENGSLVGYGYAPFHFQYSPVEKWKTQIEFVREERDTTLELDLYLKNNPLLTIVKI